MGGFAHRDSLRQRICSGRRVIHILMGLLAVVTLSLVVFGFMGRIYSATLWKMQDDVKTINRTLAAELADLQQQATNNSKTLQKVDQMVKHLTTEAKKVKSNFLDQIKKLQGTFRKVHCDLEDTKQGLDGKASSCCPRGWQRFEHSCYWLSPTLNTWTEAKGDCEEKNAHLVVLTSNLEKQFVLRLTKPHDIWIGMRFNGEVWKWVDGTPYTEVWAHWQPNEMMYSTSYCTLLYRDGLRRDRSCQLRLKWVCEKGAVVSTR